MGGRCIGPLTQTVTHLVTESVRSKKYEVNFNIFKLCPRVD